MEKIENKNCDGKCMEKYCDRDHTHFCNVDFGNMKLILTFCKQHGEEFEKETQIQLEENERDRRFYGVYS